GLSGFAPFAPAELGSGNPSSRRAKDGADERLAAQGAKAGSMKRWHQGWAVVVVALVITACTVVLYTRVDPAPIARVESEMFDLHFQMRGAETPPSRIAIVTADEKAAAELGHWPFSHRYFAVTIDRLKADGAKVIAFDVIFPQAETAMP